MEMAYICGFIPVTMKRYQTGSMVSGGNEEAFQKYYWKGAFSGKGNEVMLTTKQAFSPSSKYLRVLLGKWGEEEWRPFAATGNIAVGTFP